MTSYMNFLQRPLLPRHDGADVFLGRPNQGRVSPPAAPPPAQGPLRAPIACATEARLGRRQASREGFFYQDFLPSQPGPDIGNIQRKRRLLPDVPFLVQGPSYANGRPAAEEIAPFRAAIGDAGALAFFDYWASKCSAQGIPERAQVDPVEIPRLLPAIFIEAWDPVAEQSRIRLAGEFHRGPDGTNIQNRTIDEQTNGATAEVWKQCDRCNFFELRPTVCGYDLSQFDKRYVRHADLALPLRDTDGAVLVYGYSWLL